MNLSRYWVMAVPVLLTLAMDIHLWNQVRVFNSMAPLIEAEGTVTALDCANHGNYSVAYVAQGIRMQQRTSDPDLKRSCDSVHVGKVIPVWYSSRDSNYMTSVHPKVAEANYLGEMQGVTFGWLPIATLLVFLVTKFSKKRTRETGEAA